MTAKWGTAHDDGFVAYTWRRIQAELARLGFKVSPRTVAWNQVPPRFLIHDRDSCYGTTFDRRVRNFGLAQIRTPFRSPRANAIAERWVRSVRTECLDHVFIFNERHLQKVLAEYVGYLNPSSERPSLYVVEENRFC